MNSSSRNVVVGLGVVTAIAGLVVACGSTDESKFGDPGLDNPRFETDSGFGDASNSQEDLYKNDPPPQWCGPEGGPAPPPPPGGTEECPDDKNKPGCGCNTPGQTAACWTGLRKHRNLGVCKDGQTTCVQKNENTYQWGPCEGQVLPTPDGKGAEACTCFSAGQWKIPNLVPFVAEWTPNGGTTDYTAVSTWLEGNTLKYEDYSAGPPTKAPPHDWSTSTLKVDCAGKFKLCYRIRVGKFSAPSANDCILGEVCTAEAFYPTPNVEQPWSTLPGWIGSDKACAAKWATTPADQSPGYGEMIVRGESVTCDKIDDGAGNDFVFNRVEYCPNLCQDPANANSPACAQCGTSGQGGF